MLLTKNGGCGNIVMFEKQTLFALVAQLDRAFGYGPKGCGFNSYRAHHYIGMWLNLVEHLVWDQVVAGSNPVIPTILKLKSVGF